MADTKTSLEEEEQKDYLLHVPALVSDNILKYLRGKELLALRRVCKTSKNWVSGSGNRNACNWNGYRLEIKQDFDGFEGFDAAVRSGMNVTEIFINNSGEDGIDIYKSPGMVSFARIFGSHIRKLKVQNFGTLLDDHEFTFFESLTNLKELKLQVVDARNRHDQTESRPPVRFPRTFWDLKVLKFGDIISPENANFKSSYHWDLVRACPHLEYLRFPVASRDLDGPGTDEDVDNYYQPIMNYITAQTESSHGLTLRTLDLKYVVGDDENRVLTFGYPILLLFLHCDIKGTIKVKNAHAEMVFPYYTQYGGHPTYMTACNNVIESLTNLQPHVRMLILPHMTKLVINSTGFSCIHRICEEAPMWPSLKTVSFLVDMENENLPNLTELLFNSRERPTVEKLSLLVDEGISWSVELEELLRSCRVLSRNFFNLKTLELVRWNIKNVSLLKLWEGLSDLEELIVEDCCTFGNVALIGTDEQNPTFLKLKKLRKIRLKLDEMPCLTDRAFRDVFSKMNLKEFYLRSLNPVEKVTEAGILSLLDGEFGKSIEKFPFKNWSLATLPFLEFKELGKKFRSIL